MNNLILAEKRISHYCINFIEHVKGWTDPNIEKFLRIFLNGEIDQSGGIAEIGPYYGKFYMLMNAIVEDNFYSYAIDTNQDNSEDSKNHIKSNLVMYDSHIGKNTIFIDPKNYREDLPKKITNKIKFFSINSHKSAENTSEDLKIASKILSEHGVIALNDIGNAGYLSIMEGLINFLKDNKNIKPFCNGFNMIFLCKSSHYAKYYDIINKSKIKNKEQIFMGTNLIELTR